MLEMIWGLPWEESVPVLCNTGQRCSLVRCLLLGRYHQQLAGKEGWGTWRGNGPSFRTMMVGVCPPKDILKLCVWCRSGVGDEKVENVRVQDGGVGEVGSAGDVLLGVDAWGLSTCELRLLEKLFGCRCRWHALELCRYVPMYTYYLSELVLCQARRRRQHQITVNLLLSWYQAGIWTLSI